MNKYIAAIDQGTTSSRCIVFTQKGQIQGKAQLEHTQIYPQPGWVEHDPYEIWHHTQEVIQQAIQQAEINPSQIQAVGVTNQRETTIFWDKNSGKVYGNAIVWQDTRTREICDDLSKPDGIDLLREKVGLPLATYFSGPKLKWILENVDGAREAAHNGNGLFGNIDSWIIWWLTGGPERGTHITDVTNASRTMLMNLETLDWDDEILELFGIPRQILPRIVPSSDSHTWGSTSPEGPFQASIPVCGNLGDQQAALVGQTCFQAGEAKNTYGTGCFLLLNTGTKIIQSNSGMLTTLAYQFNDEEPIYALEGSVAITGALIQWLRDNLGLIRSSPEVEDLARSVEDNGGVYFVPAFSGLFAPYWRSDARGIITGLTRYANKGHIARAALEATAFQTREILDAMQTDSNVNLTDLKVDGGMVENELLMQFQADILGVPVVRPKLPETTSLGAAYAAGLAVGFWESIDQLRDNWEIDKTWYPQMDSEIRMNQYQNWKKAVNRCFNWI